MNPIYIKKRIDELRTQLDIVRGNAGDVLPGSYIHKRYILTETIMRLKTYL